MKTSPPIHCRRPSYELFAAQLSDLETDAALLRASIAVAMHEQTDVDPREVERQIDRLAERVQARVRSSNATALLAHLHGVLFDEEGFTGNPGDYYNARNSYLPAVLESKRGIPITLVLIYKCVAARLGLKVRGINAPGHFLAEVDMDGGTMLIDPFYGGRVLTRDEALRQIEQAIGLPLPPPTAGPTEHDAVFQPSTHRDWLARILRNLREIFSQTGRPDDQAAMQELFALL